MRTRPPKSPAPPTRHRPTVGQSLDLAIVTLDEEGYGLARVEGEDILVSGALPGETVRVRVTHVARRHAAAVVTKVLRRSPARLVTPSCSRRECDGCPLVAMAYHAQLAWKGESVARQLERYRSLAGVTVAPVLPSPRPLNYRNTAKLVVTGKFEKPVIGMYRRNSHDVIDLADCPLHLPLVNRVIAAAREGIRKGKVTIYNPRTGNGILRYLVVRVAEGTDRAMVTFVTSQRSFNEIHHLAKFVQKAVPEVTVAVQNVNPSEGNVILGEHDHFITRERALAANIGPVRLSLSPRSFFQVNSGSALLIYEKVKEWAALTGKERVVDLYCGIGGISLFLAGGAREVIGIEVVAAAVADAQGNARLNGAPNCRFEAGDAAELLAELVEEGERVDLVVLNPPRKGCDRPVLEGAVRLAPARLIYVSCSPVTLARDLDILASLGYRTTAIQPVDMFPQTPHVENVALLERE